MRILQRGVLSLIGLIASALTVSAGEYASALQINQNTTDFVGKSVAFTGKVDRVISPGTFIVSDATTESGPNHRILVMTTTKGVSDEYAKQQAGTLATTLNDGELVKLNGKIQKLAVRSELQRYAPGSELYESSSESIPVLIIKPGDLQKIG